jgi:hypothetical protein
LVGGKAPKVGMRPILLRILPVGMIRLSWCDAPFAAGLIP